MKAVIISATSHKGSTYSIGRMLAEKLTAPENLSEVFLPRDLGEFCCGCTRCIMESSDKCPHYAKLQPITEKIDSADVIIFTSPVYVFHVTGQMKAFLDHYGWRWMAHRPDEIMFSKQAVVIATAAGAGMRSTMKDMADSSFYWGIPKTYKLGKAVYQTDWKQVSPKIKKSLEARTDKLAKKISARCGKVRVSLKTKMFFNVMRMIHRNGINEADTKYWKEKGWLDKNRPWK